MQKYIGLDQRALRAGCDPRYTNSLPLYFIRCINIYEQLLSTLHTAQTTIICIEE